MEFAGHCVQSVFAVTNTVARRRNMERAGGLELHALPRGNLVVCDRGQQLCNVPALSGWLLPQSHQWDVARELL